MPCNTRVRVRVPEKRSVIISDMSDRKALIRALRRLGYSVTEGEKAIFFSKNAQSFSFRYDNNTLTCESTSDEQKIVQAYRDELAISQAESFGWVVEEVEEEEWQQ